MLRRVVDRVVRHPPLGLVVVVAAGVQVAVVAGEVAARDLDPQPVAGAEHVRGREWAECHLVDRARFHADVPVEAVPVPHAQDRVVQVDGAAIGVDMGELDGEVGVGRVGRHVQDHLDRSDHGQRLVERFRRVDEHVGAGLDAALIEGAGFVVTHAAEGAAVGRRRRARVVHETVGAGAARSGVGGQRAVAGGAVRPAVACEIQGHRLDSGRRPVGGVLPAVLAHQEVADLGVPVLEAVRLGLGEAVEEGPQHFV